MLWHFIFYLDMYREHVMDIMVIELVHELGQEVEHLDVDKGWKSCQTSWRPDRQVQPKAFNVLNLFKFRFKLEWEISVGV